MNKYVYPKFSTYELPGVRLAGPGLGNLLFIYARAIVFARKTNRKMIFPTWKSFRIGPWIRREKDKRLYNNLFENNTGDVDGLKKYFLLLTARKKLYSATGENKEQMILFTYQHMKMDFEDLKSFHAELYETIVGNLMPQNRVSVWQAENVVSVHVRLGDFVSENKELLNLGKNNIRTSIKWYVEIIKKIQDCAGQNIRFDVFSDGTDEELKEILKLPNTRRVFYGSSIADVIAMSQCKMIIASGSSFSLWARFLGQTSCVAAKGQLKCSTLVDFENAFEIEMDENETLPEMIQKKIQKMFSGVRRG